MSIEQFKGAEAVEITAELPNGAITFETGRLAKQASGAVLVTCGETVVLVSAMGAPDIREGIDFLPLSVDYVEKSYSAGKIPGNYFRREARQSYAEILTSRLMDRPIRPLFPKGYRFETQVIALVMSIDKANDPAINAMNGASAALHISDIPFAGPIAAVRVGMIDGELVANPSIPEMDDSRLNLIVAVGNDGIVMVEGESDFLPEAKVVDALLFAQEQAKPLLAVQEELRARVGKEKRPFEPPTVDQELAEKVAAMAQGDLSEAVRVHEKLKRYKAIDEVKARVKEELAGDDPDLSRQISSIFEDLHKKTVRNMILHDKVRIDGRDFETVRPIDTAVSVLPRTHGSSLFQRGETQALVTVTLGTASDEQRIETLLGQDFKSFMLHYNFYPFSVAECRFLRGPSRRDIGHGTLAERGLKSALADEEFPYTVRIVSEILESNGSSSMATVCGGSMALMQAGVPMKFPVAGIAMGLIAEGDDVAILTDILGDEDHLGDMDFKIIGNHEGVSGVQMDIKIQGLTRDTLDRALDQARAARLHILDKMQASIEESASELAPHAPRIFTVLIKPERIRDLIGPGGKHIRGIQADTGTKIDVDDDGTVRVAAVDDESAQAAISEIRGHTAEPEIGEVYMGRVVKVMDFGAFVRILPNTDGLCHISELAHRRVGKVEDVVREGDDVLVKVIGMDRGKIKLSRKAALDEQGQDEGDDE